LGEAEEVLPEAFISPKGATNDECADVGSRTYPARLHAEVPSANENRHVFRVCQPLNLACDVVRQPFLKLEAVAGAMSQASKL
jgi:hypothetical protein